LDRFPEQICHPSQIVKSRIGAAVFVNHRIFVCQCNHGCNRPTALVADAYFGFLSHTVHQIAEPLQRLRRKLVPAPRQKQQVVEPTKEHLGPPFFIGQAFSVGTMNLPLNAAFVEVVEEIFNRRPKINRM
jgi:hypothetical protein